MFSIEHSVEDGFFNGTSLNFSSYICLKPGNYNLLSEYVTKVGKKCETNTRY